MATSQDRENEKDMVLMSGRASNSHNAFLQVTAKFGYAGGQNSEGDFRLSCVPGLWRVRWRKPAEPVASPGLAAVKLSCYYDIVPAE